MATVRSVIIKKAHARDGYTARDSNGKSTDTRISDISGDKFDCALRRHCARNGIYGSFVKAEHGDTCIYQSIDSYASPCAREIAIDKAQEV